MTVTSKPCPTTSSAPVTRPWRQLYDSCGVQGQDARCTATNSACMPHKDGTWQCSCIPGFIETGVNCTKLPEGIFSTNEVFSTVPSDANIGHTVLTADFSQILNICSTKPEVTLFGDDDLFEADVTSCHNVTIRTNSRLPLESSVRHIMVKAKLVAGANVIMDAIFVTVTIQSSVNNIVVVLPDMTFSGHFVTSVAPGGTLSLSNSDFMRITSAGDVYTREQLSVADIASDDDEVATILTTNIQRLVDSSTTSTSLTAVILSTQIERRISEGRNNNFVVASFRKLLQSSLNVRVTSGINNNIFAFDGTVLKIQNAGELDYDKGQRSFSFSFTVQITSYTIPVAVAIEVLPANDNSPGFVTDTGDGTDQYSFTLFPTPISSVVCGAVRARDEDSGSQLNYTIDPQSAMVSYFTVGQYDGIVSTRVRTDMIPFINSTGVGEDQTATFTVLVRDETILHTNSCTVTVYLKRTPERNLGRNYRAGVFENVSIATAVITVSESGYTQYEFASRTGSAIFSIHPSTGLVTVSQFLDRETRDSYKFSVTAIEEKSQTCALVVIGDLNITVLDANDNSPVFGRTSYEGRVDENMPVNSIVKLDFPITATDADIGSFTFRITQESSRFAISQSGEISTIQRFDREATTMYNVAVVADDGKNTNQAVVKVTIGDRNDNDPVFPQASYSVTISENTMDNNLISVPAVDNDAGRNANLSYLLDGGGDSFDIGYKTGVVSVTVPLDRELQSSYGLTVTAIDGGDPPRSSSTTVTVSVDDVNDNSPVFIDSSLVMSTDEEVPCLTNPIGILSAIDNDDSDTLQYSTSDARFTVDQNTGEIKCVNILDYEEQQQYKLPVTVRDKGSSPRQTSGTVIINLRDINDNTPNITHPDTASLQQNDFVESRPVMVVDAEDKDSGENGQVTFSLTGANMVSIDDNGIISTVAGATPAASTYYATVKVEDRGFPSRSVTSTVAIQVTANTNVNLRFGEQQHKFDVSEEKEPNTVVGDLSQNLENRNSLVPNYDIPNPSDVFTIDSITGVLRTKMKLDRETKAEHIVFVRVRESGATTGDLTLVNVSVADTNDHPPAFFRDKYRMVVKEDTAVDSVITTISVTDKDVGVNAEIHFSLNNGLSSECSLDFNVNERNGQLQVVRELDYETYIACQFTVQAFDKSSSPLTSSVEVDITIKDVNDNSPSFSEITYQIDVAESFRTETSIFGTVSDADSNENGRVQLSDGNSNVCPFRIKTDTKSLIMTLGENAQLDYETETSYICVIVATDMASSNPRTSSATVTVSIIDVNDNPPIFSSPSYKVNISRDLGPGYNVITVMATDADSGLNKLIHYDIAGDDDYLDIDSNTGQVSVGRSLYDYRRDIMVTTVVATDQTTGSPDRLSSSVTLTINIKDDNVRPNFPTSTVYKQLQEETEVTGVFYTAMANDWDGTTNRRCLCTYRLETTSNVFEVDSQSGEIGMRTGTSVDRERDGPYVSLGIIARDQGSPQKDSETLILNITVLDINDQSPRFRYNYIPIFKIYQTLSPGSEIGTVTSEDMDGIQYSVTLYNITDLFYSASGTFSDRDTSRFGPSTIVADRNNGTLRTTRSLELIGQTATFYIMLTVEAVDQNDPSMKDTTPVIVEVKYADPNQYYPRFTKDVYQTEIPRSHPQTDAVLTVSATDADPPPKNSIKYSIAAGNYRDVMSIDTRSGVIKLTYLLDEKFDASNLTLTVRATDGGDIPKYNSSTVRITLAGDYLPCFTSAMRTEIVAEKDLFFAVMLGLVGALCIAIGLCFILFYKYRTVDKQLAVYAPSESKKKDNTYSGLQPLSERRDPQYDITGSSETNDGYEPLPGPEAPGGSTYSTVPELRGTAEQSHMNPAYSASEADVAVGFPNQRV
ncbi:Protocadherin Fat 4 [Mizuhopecten yessoensis]|uniref:Protocadherin Fat 4 n=2 Tax=Mizuhopecten yessoensis TaxID=6573 RepID=A0A210PVT6_MIZYE|nr:Protocadherin Fat 4 [Mizuhopecten yessoensis]